MSTGIAAPRSRRTILAAAAGAAAATVVAAIERPAAVLAGTDGDVVLGAANTASATTSIVSSTGIPSVLKVEALGNAAVAIDGVSVASNGVRGTSTNMPGVFGRATDECGVFGSSPHWPGVRGESAHNAGVEGYSTSQDQAGVFGYAGGEGPGVRGYSRSSIGVEASSDSGTALKVVGKASFSRSGRALMAKGRYYVDVDLRTKGGLAGTPLCFANLMSYRPGVYVSAVRPNNPSTGKLRIYLNKAASSATYVAWVVLG
jgi:hypothetical protein